jgi:hypothetical protein
VENPVSYTSINPPAYTGAPMGSYDDEVCLFLGSVVGKIVCNLFDKNL